MSAETAEGAAGAGGILGFMGHTMAGQNQAQELGIESQVASQNAGYAISQAQFNAQKGSLYANKILGDAAANYGASGVDRSSGSVMAVMAASSANAEFDRQNTLYGGQIKAQMYDTQANLDSIAASNAETAGSLGAVGSLVQSAGSIAAISAFA